jgi:hypothetical protein
MQCLAASYLIRKGIRGDVALSALNNKNNLQKTVFSLPCLIFKRSLCKMHKTKPGVMLTAFFSSVIMARNSIKFNNECLH